MLDRSGLIEKIEGFLAGRVKAEDLGWWAFDMMVDPGVQYEPGFERLLRDTLQAVHYFHDTEPIMRQFYPDREDLLYFLRCLKGEEMYNPKKVPQWKA